ncbi:MAG: PARP-type zinc finger-containing protein, partial [Candidatus Odinarchaeota archaeon]
VLESKEKGESATKEEITGILSEQLVKYMREQGTWPRTTRLSSYAEDGSAMISYGPEPDVNIELRITEDQIGDKLPKFLGSLKTMEERIQEAEAHLTWRVEHAKSGRAACRACSEKIQKGELRIGEPSLFQDHVSYKWYHVDCSSRKSFFLSPVEGLEQLTPEEKKELVNNGLLDDE